MSEEEITFKKKTVEELQELMLEHGSRDVFYALKCALVKAELELSNDNQTAVAENLEMSRNIVNEIAKKLRKQENGELPPLPPKKQRKLRKRGKRR